MKQSRRDFLKAGSLWTTTAACIAVGLYPKGASTILKAAEEPTFNIPTFHRWRFEELVIPKYELSDYFCDAPFRIGNSLASRVNIESKWPESFNDERIREPGNDWLRTNAGILREHLRWCIAHDAKKSIHHSYFEIKKNHFYSCVYVQHVLCLQEDGDNLIYHECEIVAADFYARALKEAFSKGKCDICYYDQNRKPPECLVCGIPWSRHPHPKYSFLKGV